ncbi:oligosaccharide flippase family protein [Candidatus Woesearchaeota archaeon]|nr:oligosaccharide flippase family protein [Candidatus Woesearchaeota archaeon]
MGNYTSKLLQGAGIIFVFSLFTSLSGYFIRLVLAHKLSQEDFGLFFAVYNVVLLIGWIKGFGFSSAIGKFVPELKVKDDFAGIKSIIVFMASFTFLSTIVMFIIAYFLPSELLNYYFKSGLGRPLLFIFFVYIIIDGFSQVMTGFFISTHHFALYASRDLMIRLIILIGLLAFGSNVINVGWIYVIGVLGALLINSYFFFRQFKFFSYPLIFNKPLLKEVFIFSTPLVLRDVFGVLMARVDTLMLTFFRPLKEVAIYNAILPTAELLMLLGRPFGRVMFPLSSELQALKEQQQIVYLLHKTHKYLLMLLLALYGIIFFFSDLILGLLFGPEYAIGSLGLKILGLGILLSSLNLVDYDVLMGLGKSKEATKIILGANVLNLVLNLIFIPWLGRYNLGYLGAIITTTISSIFVTFLLIYNLRKFAGYKPPFREWFISGIVGGIVLFGGPWLFSQITEDIYLRTAFFFLSLGIYAGLLLLLKVVSVEEIKSMVRLVTKKEEKLN